MEESYHDNVLGEVTLRRSHLARSISIKIGRDGAITLTYPVSMASAQRAIEFMESKRALIIKKIERNSRLKELNPPASSYNKEELEAKARGYLPGRIEHISSTTNLRFNKLTLRASCSRWGSCSSQNNISLSIYLMILPPHLIDFVIIHELCHTVHHNHSAKFHELVDYITSGREKVLERELKKYSIR